MNTRYIFWLRFSIILADIILINCAYILAFLYVTNFRKALEIENYTNNIFIFNLLWVISSGWMGIYGQQAIRHLDVLFRATWRSFALHQIAWWGFLFFTKDQDISRQFSLVLMAFLAVGLFSSRFMFTAVEIWYRKHFKYRPKVAVWGNNELGNRLAAYFKRSKNDVYFSGFLDNDETFAMEEAIQWKEALQNALQNAYEQNIKEIYAVVPPTMAQQLEGVMLEAESMFIRLKLVPDLNNALSRRFYVGYLGGMPVMSLRHEPMEDMGNRFKKRAMDLVLSVLVIVLLLSWLYPIIALLIKWQSPGPVLFRQQRNGRDNALFWCLKFRSMYENMESNERQASKDDERITPIGKFLRKTSLDELPQFLNVFWGQMSVVGPRPHMLRHTEQYREIIDDFMVRHLLKPGITGWAQVTGFRGETKDPKLMEERVSKDIWYLENWTLMLDVRIIFLTIWQMLRADEKAF